MILAHTKIAEAFFDLGNLRKISRHISKLSRYLTLIKQVRAMIIEFFIYLPEPGSNLKFPSESLKDKRKLRVKALLLCLFLIQPRTASQIVQGNYPRQKTKS